MQVEMTALPFADRAFDAVISIQVLYHATRAGMERAFAEIARVLPPGGPFIVSLLSTRTWKFGEGEQLEPLTYVQPRGLEAGVPHHYCDEAEARALLSGFDIERLELDEHPDEDGNIDSHWEIRARRR
jgi:SAM-dependent methyltransferase